MEQHISKVSKAELEQEKKEKKNPNELKGLIRWDLKVKPLQ